MIPASHFRALNTLAKIIRSGERLPLPWVVEFGSEFNQALLTADPALALLLAGRFLQKDDLIRMALSLANRALRASESEDRLLFRALEWTKEWAEGGKISIDSLTSIGNQVLDEKSNLRMSGDVDVYNAVFHAVSTARLTSMQFVNDMYIYRNGAADNAAETFRSARRVMDEYEIPDKEIVEIVRSYFRKAKITLAALASAGEAGWVT